MSRRLCDEVMMRVPSQEDTGLAISSELLAHIECCPNCRDLVKTKTAVTHALSTARLDPIAQRRLQIGILSHNRPSPRTDKRVFTRTYASLTAAFSVLLLASVGAEFFKMKVPADEHAIRTAVVGERSEHVDNDDKSIEAPGTPVPTPNDESLVLSQGAALWMKKGTKLEILNDSEKLAKTRVKKGRIVVDIRRHPKGFRFVVETPSAEVEALGTVFSVNVSQSGEETVRVVESAVLVRRKNGGDPSVVRAGEQLILGISAAAPADALDLQSDLELVRGVETPSDIPPAVMLADAETAQPSKPVRSLAQDDATSLSVRIATAIDTGRLDEAEQLLKQGSGSTDDEQLRLLFKLAGAYRNRRQYSKTVAIYEHLVSAYPRRDAAINTLVSIAQIKQGFLKDPAGAIFYYDKYLKKRPRGVLAEAAGAGKVRALFSLRQWQDVLEASDTYLESFPTGISKAEIVQKRARAKKQLDEVI